MKYSLSLLAVVMSTACATAQDSTEQTSNIPVPERAIILSGGENGIHRAVMGVLYDTDATFNDPDAPRFLLIDRKGTTVFGIGGYVEGVAQYDFGGAIDSYPFAVDEIPVPADPAKRSRLGADASRTTLVFNLLHNTKFGVLSAYFQANFSNPNYGFKLKQAYIRLNHVTMGLTRSTFQDALATPATIDYDGPSGMIDKKNFLLQYKNNYANGLGFAVSVEMPSASYSVIDGQSESISQRLPDVPAYIQYQWDGGKSHIRATAMLRNLSYRDLVTAENKFVTGYGVQLSGAVQCGSVASVLYQASYGKGIGTYQESLESQGFDLIPASEAGKLEAPRSFGFSGGIRINPCEKLFLTSSYSMLRLYDQERLGGDTFRRANYAVVNAFYNPIPELQFGLEYLHGRRTEMSGINGKANRIQAMVKYSF